jgi:sodium-dependent dicarboxylate transporter 2/3/5
MADLMRAGIYMNLIGVVIITGLLYLLGLAVFNIDPAIVPDWAIAG